MPRVFRLPLAFAALACAATLGVARATHAGEPHCARCGCAGECRKVCRLVCEEKTVNVTCWGCKCEDFCLGGPSHLECRHAEEVCDFCDAPTKAGMPVTLPKTFAWNEWCASWAKVRTKTKLVKKVVAKKVPSQKWVVEDLCSECASLVRASSGDQPTQRTSLLETNR